VMLESMDVPTQLNSFCRWTNKLFETIYVCCNRYPSSRFSRFI
jgi:hypothetical protein